MSNCPLYVTRLSFNSSGWKRPTGDARKYEQSDTYNHINGFGHEDWLFRNEWQLNGWRYAFLQGVNKSHQKLIKQGLPVDITLFSILPDKKRKYVATLGEVECLTDSQAEAALEQFRSKGWLGTMLDEIRAVDGNAGALGNAEWARHVLNVRFRESRVAFFPPKTYASTLDPIQRLPRYSLTLESRIAPAQVMGGDVRKGSSELPVSKEILRRAVAATICSAEHSKMQAALMLALREEYPGAEVKREVQFVDVSVRTRDKLVLFEIKSDLSPTSVIREALGQLMEYAYYPTRRHDLPVELVIVGRNRLQKSDAVFLEILRVQFRIPVTYRVQGI